MKNRNMILFVLATFLTLFNGGCSPSNEPNTPGSTTGGSGTVSSVTLSTDKACYSPGETIHFTSSSIPKSTYVRYYYSGNKLSETSLSNTTWTWNPPTTDFRGYLVEVLSKGDDGTETILGSIGVDVSSDWTRFPRYGFLSSFGDVTKVEMESVVSSLNRYHINGVQFYDWQYEHHKPLAGTRNNPDAYWTDIAKRNTSLATIQGYITALHNAGMKTMFYNLCYGALSDAASDGVKDEWYLYNDKNHNGKNCLELSQPMFKSYIYLTNPANTDWQNYLANRNDDVYSVFDFDGYHIDQLGNRGTVYDYSGESVYLPTGFASFIQAMKAKHSAKRLVMNAVSRYGSKEIAGTGNVDFLYNEVWSEDANYSSLKDIVDQNNSFGNGSLKTVFAAYMNYNKAENAGYFNDPGVILADAVIFALGGAHLEMGEHMLGKEYFPNSNLKMDSTLQSAMIHYYDFLVAYQNLLRDSGSFNTVDLSCTNSKISVSAWPPSSGNVTVLAKKINNNTQVIHLVNLSQADYLSWRDLNGTMPEPSLKSNIALQLKGTDTINRIWVASPDNNDGVCQEVAFSQSASNVSFTLPSLKYWDMIVIEYK